MASPKKLVRKVVKGRALRGAEQGFRKSRGLALQARYGFPARGMKVIAVTGTNGKSTTCSYINEVLKAGGLKTAVLTTVFYEIAGVQEPNKTHQTIDKQSIVQRFFAKAKKAKVDWVILEVTSHAIDQARIMGVKVDISVITNLTQDHLDYHGTMEEYARVKSLLLSDYGAKWAVLNRDDDWFEFFQKRSTADVFTIGKAKGTDATMQRIQLTTEGSSEKLVFKEHTLNLHTQLLGEFNLYNATASASVGHLVGLSPEQIEQGVANLSAVSGRMESVDAGQDFTVLVDYAYTSDAIEQALKSLRQITTGKIRIVFGAAGDRDKGKRPLMGEAAAKYADYIYLTDDETYTEDPVAIRDAVYKGIKSAGGAGKTKVIDDRLDAIKTAFSDAKKGDIVYLTGLGHEDYRNMGGKKIPWDEREVAKTELKQLTK